MMKKVEYELYDALELVKKLPDGAYLKGERGRYFIQKEERRGTRVGSVMLNRKYLSGLFKPKNPKGGLMYLGDTSGMMLMFMRRKDGGIDVFQRPKKKK